MRGEKIIVQKDGILVQSWNEERKKYDVRLLPQDVLGVLAAWNDSVEIRGRVRLFDLLNWLRQLDRLALDVVAQLTEANLSAYLGNLPESKQDTKTSKLIAIEVYKIFGWTNQEDLSSWFFRDGWIHAHGIEKRGRKEIAYAIEFTPWDRLLSLPLRLAKTAIIDRTTWKKEKPRRMGWVRKGAKRAKHAFTTDRIVEKQENFKVSVTYTFGEFLRGLFDEICFFWTPEQRDREEKILQTRFEEVSQAQKKGTDDFYELKEIP